MAPVEFLVTGGTGFVGVHVIRDLLSIGRRVAAFDLHPDLELLALVAGPEATERIAHIQADVAAASEVFAAVAETRAEVIIHLASSLPPDCERNATSSFRGMTEGQMNVLEAARLFAVRRVVFASAPSVFGHPRHHGGVDQPIGNDAPHYPETLYGLWKSANERLAQLYWNRYGVDSIGLRFCQGYGPGKKRGRPYGYLVFDAALTGTPCRVPYGDDVINWQYVEDMSRLIVAACEAKPTTHRCFNTTGEVLPMREAVKILLELAPEARFEVETGVADFPWHYDTSMLQSEIGVDSHTTVAEGFRRTLDTMRRWRAMDR